MLALPAVAVSKLHNLVGRAMHDLDELALLRPRHEVSPRKGHAVVLGGSWTGMLTAAVLSPYFERVTIVERDSVDDTVNAAPGQCRRGVPHGAQSHVVLPYAVRFVRALLPDFEAALRAQGGHTGGDMGVDFDWFHRGSWRLRQPLGLPMWFASRALVEWTMRREVLRTFGNLTFVGGTQASGLVAGDGDFVGGVYVGDVAGERALEAELVVDCTGKNSHAAQWLEKLRFSRVREERVDAKTFYATCRLRRTDESLRTQGHWARTLHGAPGAEGGHFAGAVTVENNDICVWAVRAGAKPPANTDAFADFLAGLEVPDFHRFATDAAHVDGGQASAFNLFGPGPARRRLFEKAARLPHNFVVLGDAACSTDPSFGLGLSISASTVAALAAALHARHMRARALAAQQAQTNAEAWSMRDLGREMAKRVGWRTVLPWLLTAAEDYRFRHTRGPHRGRLWVRALQAYIDRAFQAAHHDPRVDSLVLRVVGLVAHPLHVFGPLIFKRVLMSHNLTLEVADECSIEAGVGSR